MLTSTALQSPDLTDMLYAPAGVTVLKSGDMIVMKKPHARSHLNHWYAHVILGTPRIQGGTGLGTGLTIIATGCWLQLQLPWMLLLGDAACDGVCRCVMGFSTASLQLNALYLVSAIVWYHWRHTV